MFSCPRVIIDNVTLNIDGVLYLRIRDPYKASYGVEDPEFAITQLAQTTMRYLFLYRKKVNIFINIIFDLMFLL